MSSTEIPRYNDSKKTRISNSTNNPLNSKERGLSPKKVSFFNPVPNPQKIPNNRYFDNSRNINEEDSDDYNSNLSSDTYDEDREKQLEIVNEKFQNLFVSREKIYGNIIKEINAEKKLFFKKSIMSFNLLILKIKCLIKLLKSKFVESLTTKDYYEMDVYIHKIKRDFKNLNNFINEDSKYEYELTTQVYAKFLYLMGIINSKKEEHITSFSYIALGVNILKVFFIRQGFATNIETYQIYAKLVVMLINKLLCDNNLSQALIYINLLTRICEIGLNLINQTKNGRKFEGKFNKYQSYGFLYLGFIYELSTKVPNNTKIALKAYKEAYYFMNKTPNKMTIFAELSSVITLERKALYLAQILFEKLTEKLTLEQMEKQKEYEHQEKLKKQKLEEARNEEKKYRLKLIACGVSPENPNLTKIQEKIFSEILTPNNQALIDKLDDELISYVYRNKHINMNEEKEEQKKEKKEEKETKEKNKMPSMEVMKTLCHYKMYNNLMSDDYKEFLLHNRHLLFNCPSKEKNTLDKIQKYLNRKMEIGTNNNTNKEIKENKKSKDKKKKNKEIKEKQETKEIKENKPIVSKENSHLILKTEIDANTNISSESNKLINKLSKSINNLNSTFNNKLIETNKNSIEEQEISKNNNININTNNNNNLLYKSYRNPSKHSYIMSKEKEKDKEKNQRCMTFSNYTNSILINKNQPQTQKPKSLSTLKRLKIKNPSEVENRRVDKFIFNKKYFKEYSYFENLTNKELLFQKILLEQKNSNAKMFFKGYQTELDSQGIVPREEILNSFLILNDKVTSKERNYEKEMKIEIEFKTKPRIFGNMFKSVSTKMKEGKKIKNAVGKVLDKYLMAQKKEKEKKRKILDKKTVNKKNELSILQLNDNIKQINYLLSSKNSEIQKNKKRNFFENHYTQD